MKCLAIMGSYRKGKNTDQALDALLEGLDKNGIDITKLFLGDMNVGSCRGCDHCGITGHCIIKDDMEIIYNRMDESDIVIIAAPTYFNAINSLTKSMVDRAQRYWNIKYTYGRDKIEIKNKLGMFITVGGAQHYREQFVASDLIIDMFFKSINAKYVGSYFISNTDDKEVNKREDITEELRRIGESFETISQFSIQK